MCRGGLQRARGRAEGQGWPRINQEGENKAGQQHPRLDQDMNENEEGGQRAGWGQEPLA